MPRYYYYYNETTNEMDLSFYYNPLLDSYSKSKILFVFIFLIIVVLSIIAARRAFIVKRKITFFTVLGLINAIGSLLKVTIICVEWIEPSSFLQVGVTSFFFNFNYILIHCTLSALVFYWIHKYHDSIKNKKRSWSSVFVCLVFLSFNSFGVLVCFLISYCESNRIDESQFYTSCMFIVNIVYFLADVSYAGSLFVYGFLIGKNHKKSLGILCCSIALGITFLYNAVELFTTAFVEYLNETQGILFDFTDLINISMIYLCLIGIIHYDTRVRKRVISKKILLGRSCINDTFKNKNDNSKNNFANDNKSELGLNNINDINSNSFGSNSNNISSSNNNNIYYNCNNNIDGSSNSNIISTKNNSNNNNNNNNIKYSNPSIILDSKC
ncbi:hypothetical protein DICPUDRAFT_79989 [Dictyostelium purpureum]|uniref:THH1/TOM1/TOM3 domain-containing protein n=1 Tax=Dictyostelium purpureum TaxID=5786 RepID=F0ZP76_DICPU|nr:uncharacterized protein DICPUDRAFT_79989 [Dictyostelium purpureum]EGC34246.1 hypothetical protein DICPUDRAFT_79989 [Dictyostelium purpureum]|eukprot:XP_003289215.1 hypothetical protein DICPUDRAFT_79989 [Dictyostelium purpureum]